MASYNITGKIVVSLNFDVEAESYDEAESKSKEMVKGITPHPLFGNILDITVFADELLF